MERGIWVLAVSVSGSCGRGEADGRYVGTLSDVYSSPGGV